MVELYEDGKIGFDYVRAYLKGILITLEEIEHKLKTRGCKYFKPAKLPHECSDCIYCCRSPLTKEGRSLCAFVYRCYMAVKELLMEAESATNAEVVKALEEALKETDEVLKKLEG